LRQLLARRAFEQGIEGRSKRIDIGNRGYATITRTIQIPES
jgi:hypothetical protein